MISFSSNNGFSIVDEERKRGWIKTVIEEEHLLEGEINYVFCDDAFLLQMNKKYLAHDTYTDVISFDYTKDGVIAGEIYISTERVVDNAVELCVDFYTELDRVMIHGVLHFCGYKDKTPEEEMAMRAAEDKYLAMRKS